MARGVVAVIRSFLGVVALAGIAAVTVPHISTALLEKRQHRSEQTQASLSDTDTRPAAPGGKVLLEADAGHHYRGAFRMNGRAIEGLIDTGATTVALSETSARRLGILPVHYLGKVEVATANGRLSAARVLIERMEIGSIAVQKVEAVVLPDKALSTTLIGMSFLNKIGSYRVADGTMELVR